MKIIATTILALGSLAVLTQAAEGETKKFNLPIADGPFVGTDESLSAYKCPKWFRDAKFGIWAHWGPQSMGCDGQWYARDMYVAGCPAYQDHIDRFGHPSVSGHGYKDMLPLWKAEKWDPDRLMALYKKAGAKYFVTMGVHHDNFDLWDSSKTRRWNSVTMGPKKDVVALWQKAAKKEGLRFGISEHLAASFTWFQKSHGAPSSGPYKGVPFDGADPAFQDLYHFPAEPGDTGWTSTNPRWQQEWYDRIHDLVNRYPMDLMYSDSGFAFGNEVGRNMIAHLYNTDLKRRGKLEVVYTSKQGSNGRWVEDLERGVMPKINPDAWQTDTSVGGWFYIKNYKQYRATKWFAHTLADVVSKNGNLLLNIVQAPDGSIDPEEERLLEEIAEWNKANGEAIFGTRPWQVYGESSVRFRGGNFKEDFAYSAKDIRFTTKGATLYAIALGWPADGKIRIRSLASPASGGNQIGHIALLGVSGDLKWNQDAAQLVVTLPEEKRSEITTTLKITGTDLKAVPFVQVYDAVIPDAKGDFSLTADDVDLHGEGLSLGTDAGCAYIGPWTKGDQWVSWKVNLPTAGVYALTTNIGTRDHGTEFVVELDNQKITGKTVKGEGMWDWKAIDLGKVTLTKTGEQTIAIRARNEQAWRPIDLRSLMLHKVE